MSSRRTSAGNIVALPPSKSDYDIDERWRIEQQREEAYTHSGISPELAERYDQRSYRDTCKELSVERSMTRHRITLTRKSSEQQRALLPVPPLI